MAAAGYANIEAATVTAPTRFQARLLLDNDLLKIRIEAQDTTGQTLVGDEVDVTGNVAVVLDGPTGSTLTAVKFIFNDIDSLKTGIATYYGGVMYETFQVDVSSTTPP